MRRQRTRDTALHPEPQTSQRSPALPVPAVDLSEFGQICVLGYFGCDIKRDLKEHIIKGSCTFPKQIIF